MPLLLLGRNGRILEVCLLLSLDVNERKKCNLCSFNVHFNDNPTKGPRNTQKLKETRQRLVHICGARCAVTAAGGRGQRYSETEWTSVEVVLWDVDDDEEFL